MAVVVNKLVDAYHFVNNDLADPRVRDYPMTSNPLPVIAIVIVYNIFVQYVGPWWMKNRNPYNLKPVIATYDFFQVVINFWIFFKTVQLSYWSGKYNWFCQPVETGMSEEETMILNLVYYYFLTKLSDLFDTVIFVLNKKVNHISFLHVYHHSGMVICSWLGFKYVPGGHSMFFGIVNVFVHGFMYMYYLLSVLKYIDSRHDSWKRRLTQLQMVQFGLMAIHHMFVLVSPHCEFPRLISFLIFPQQIFMFILFAEFYRKMYLKQKTS